MRASPVCCLLLVVAWSVGLCSCNLLPAFGKWMAENGKSYSSPGEQRHRFDTWRRNLAIVTQFNFEGGHTYKLGMNRFADLTNEEFVSQYLAPMPNSSASNWRTRGDVSEAAVGAPESIVAVDWRSLGAVTPVKDQGECSSYWAFSAIGALEGCHEIATKSLLSLSEQQLIDCAFVTYGNKGCNGGLPANGFNYVIDYWSELETAYPYTESKSTCLAKDTLNSADCTGYTATSSGSEVALQYAVQKTPVSVSIDASGVGFQFYKSGIYCPSSCSTSTLNHAAVIVGMNSDSTGDYYIVKNSWGTSWGIQGYIWMCANKNNNCGIATQAVYPTGCK
ncbi:cathepsin L1 [Pelomyxa schiedti]|nr:cathepsin L1 [Pelomyxa schiedti]